MGHFTTFSSASECATALTTTAHQSVLHLLQPHHADQMLKFEKTDYNAERATAQKRPATMSLMTLQYLDPSEHNLAQKSTTPQMGSHSDQIRSDHSASLLLGWRGNLGFSQGRL